MSAATLLQCYNKGCGQKFNPSENLDECQYHPGEPVFHDAEKSWSCCKQRSKDFTMFLSMPGCSKGQHSSSKPVTTSKPESAPVVISAPTVVKPVEVKSRPSFDAEMTLLTPIITPSLKNLLLKSSEKKVEEEVSVDPATGIVIGEPCKRNGCTANYESVSSNLDLCQYHSGGPVFHEGLKFWSCCKKKTTDFSDFLAQVGCTTDKHLWKDDKNSSRKTVCRYDWHQTGTHVCLTIYAKGTLPEKSLVSVSPVRVTTTVVHGDNLQFDLDIELEGVIEPSGSSVTFAGTKVELKMKKADAGKWTSLNKLQATLVDTKEEHKDTVDDLDVDAVDLSDL